MNISYPHQHSVQYQPIGIGELKHLEGEASNHPPEVAVRWRGSGTTSRGCASETCRVRHRAVHVLPVVEAVRPRQPGEPARPAGDCPACRPPHAGLARRVSGASPTSGERRFRQTMRTVRSECFRSPRFLRPLPPEVLHLDFPAISGFGHQHRLQPGPGLADRLHGHAGRPAHQPPPPPPRPRSSRASRTTLKPPCTRRWSVGSGQ